VTVAPATTAFDESVTCPTTAPVLVACAPAERALVRQNAITSTTLLRQMPYQELTYAWKASVWFEAGWDRTESALSAFVGRAAQQDVICEKPSQGDQPCSELRPDTAMPQNHTQQ
jgi:hypothetical protein